LKELAVLLRPLFLAVFLAYIVMPLQHRLRQRTHGIASFIGLAAATLFVLLIGSLLTYSSIVDLNQELPRLLQRGRELFGQGRDYVEARWPALARAFLETGPFEEQATAQLKETVSSLANLTAGVLLEALEVAFYLVFLLHEARHFSSRIENGFENKRAEQILAVVGRINAAMASYLKVKVRANLVLALPLASVLWAFGTKFIFLWAVLFFLSNFIPYFGSILACTLAALYAFLQLDWGWQPFAVAVLLFAVRTAVTDFLEPAMTGKAINLSPLVILAALSFWSLCWGLTGMLLAVPLTVMFKIILENVDPARPFARMLAET
jgi:predicted PurR-regulated permease PerM